MRRGYLVLLAVIAAALVLVLPSTALAEPGIGNPVPTIQAQFTGLDGEGTTWEVHARGAASPWLGELPGSSETRPFFFLGHGVISLVSRESLPDGSVVEKGFTVHVKFDFSLDSFGSWLDAGAAAGICGYVVDAWGEGVPAVGDFYLFYFWDGAHGLTQPDGTVTYYPDRWYFEPAEDSAKWMRSYQRRVLYFFDAMGTRVAAPNEEGYPSWPVTEGDIDIKNGLIYG